MREFIADLEAVARDARALAADAKRRPEWSALEPLAAAANSVGRAWSGSSIGYQASVYYDELAAPPVGAHFSQEWGWVPSISGGTRGEWREFRYDEVVAYIRAQAGDPDLSDLEALFAELRVAFESAHATYDSIASVALVSGADPYLEGLAKKSATFAPLTIESILRDLQR